MNENGKFKKATMIVMIVSVVFIIACILWVLIFRGENNFDRSNREFFEQTSSAKYVQEVANNEIQREIEITVSATFALDGTNKTSKLTNEQKQAGFKSVTNNGDNTLTYKIMSNDYERFINSYRNDMLININGYFKTDFPSAQNVDYNNDLTEITVKMSRADFNSGDIETTATLASLPAMTYQMYALLETHCTVRVVDAANGSVMGEYEF